MKNNITFLTSPGQTFHVIPLRCTDTLHFDPAPLVRLFATKPQSEAEAIVCRVLQELAARLDGVQQGLTKADHAVMLRSARKILIIAEQLGVTEVAVSVGHVITCLRQCDQVALHATVSRLERAFDVAVAEVWNFRSA